MPAGQPQIDLQWRDRWNRLDELAGCQSEWSFGTGNPCASDVPILWAKKGIEIDSDEAWLNRFGIENARSTCLEYAPGGNESCTKWMESKGGCWREEAALCTCRVGLGDPGRGCREWDCLAKDVHHQQCWEANWDEAFNTECGPAGNSPWPLGRDIGINHTEFRTIFTAESSDSALATSYDQAVNILKSKQNSNWYRYGGHCVAQRTVGNKPSRKPPSPCQTWRQISSKAWSCRCLADVSSASPCKRWQCDGSALSALERYTFECLEYSGSKCIRWSAEVEGPLAQMGECRSCTSPQACNFVCRYISMHRIVEIPLGATSSWGERLGHAILHLLWLLPLALMISLVVMDEKKEMERWWGAGVFGCCFMAILVVFAWLVAFFRNMKDSGSVPPLPRWDTRRPADPVLGLFFTFGLALLLGWLSGMPREKNTYRHLGPATVVPLVVVFLCFLWPCGMAAAWLPFILLLVVFGVQLYGCLQA